MTDEQFYELAAGIAISGMDTDSDVIEHHGVKGQKWGERNYQYKDGSLTALGKRHYGIGDWIKSRFNPAERGYRAAVKQKQQQQKMAVKKAKYATDLNKMLKHPKYFTDDEIQKKIDADTRRQQSINRLKAEMNADKIRKKEERIANQERKDARKAEKFEQKMREEELKSRERQHALTQQTALELQKQKDSAQAAREQAAREYQTQKEIAQGKSLLGRLQKGAKMVAAISGIFGSGKKIAEAIGIDTSSFIDEWTPKKKETASTDTKNADSKKEKKEVENDKEDKRNISKVDIKKESEPTKSEVANDIKKEERETKENKPEVTKYQGELPPAVTPPSHLISKKYSFDSSIEANKKNLDALGYSKGMQETITSVLTGYGKQEIKNEPPTHQIKEKYASVFSGPTPINKSEATNREAYYAKGKTLSFKEAAEEGENEFRRYANRANGIVPRREREAKKAAEREAKQAEQQRQHEAEEKARDIKRRWDNFYDFQKQSSGGASIAKSDTGNFITSTSVSKLADILMGNVSTSYPHINLGTAMNERIGNGPTSYGQEYNNSSKMLRKQIKGHRKEGRWSDIDEDAGEVEDAE